MKSSVLKFNKIFISTWCLIGLSIASAKAQKLSDIQEGSVWAPTVKVDGKLTEWESRFKANNKSTNLTYTIANDAKNLYLAIQSKEVTNNNKIMLGGITLTVNPTGKKNDKDGFKITYPIISRGQRRLGGGQGGGGNNVTVSGGGGQGSGGSNVTITRVEGGGGGGFRQFQDMTPTQRDSLQRVVAKTQLANAKEIKVFGFKDIPDSLISIYNEYSIKAIATISETGVFMYEVAVPLELLEMSADKPKEFSYNIKINGLQINFGGFGGGARAGGGGGGGGNISSIRVEGGGGGGFGNANFQDLITPTDFWGKYTLTNGK